MICDDNKSIVMSLKSMVSQFFASLGQNEPEYVLSYSGEELLATNQIGDIALLDVEMEGISGILTGEELKKRNPRIKIIIVTSYSDYLDEAMKFHVFRYLSKPVDRQRLNRCLKEAIYQINTYSKTVVIKANGAHQRIFTEDIMCVESTGRGAIIHLTDKDILSSQGIEYWASELSIPCFYSTDRRFIVNMKYVSSFDSQTINLIHESKSVDAYISRRKYKDFKSAYLMFVRTRE